MNYYCCINDNELNNGKKDSTTCPIIYKHLVNCDRFFCILIGWEFIVELIAVRHQISLKLKTSDGWSIYNSPI